MDYNYLKIQAGNAFKYYRSDKRKYNQSMKNLYSEGKNNPSVTRIILDNAIIDGILKISNFTDSMLKNVKISQPALLPADTIINNLENEAALNISAQCLSKAIHSGEISADKDIQNTTEKQQFDFMFKKLYPISGEKRSRIIDAHRIKMDKVTQKADWLKKIFYAKTIAEYQELYPKSWSVRTELISKHQIKSNEVTKRVSGFFNRLSYRSVIKNLKKIAK